MVRKVFSLLEDPSLFFNKVYAIIGTFGSGKTTIINYIRYNFHIKSIKICSLNIEWKPIVSKISGPHEIRNWFIEEMRDELLQACDRAMLAALPDQREDLKVVAKRLANKEDFDEKGIIKCIEELRPYYGGFTILMDELHRVPEYQHVLDFFKFEQSFFQSVCKHPVVIFIACSDEWVNNFELPQYSGIFDEFVHLPSWTSAKEAYELIDKRLRDASADPLKFKNPLSRNALNKIANLPNVKTPRDWIKYAKRIFENLPEDVSQITPSVVGKAISFVDISTVDKIRNLARFQFESAYKLISMVLRLPAPQATGLLNAIAHIYHQPLPRPLTEKALESIDIEDFPILLATLQELKIVIKDTQSSPPIKSKWGVVEIHQRNIYRLNPKLTEFFEKVEARWGLDPEDYILRFLEAKTAITVAETREDEQNLKRMKMIANNLQMPRAKNHILRATEDYEAFIKTIFSASPIDRATLRSGIMTIYNIVAAFSVEKTKDAQHLVDMDKDLERLQKVLMPGKALVQAVADLFQEFREIEDTGKPLTEGMSTTIKKQFPEIINRLITQLDRWTSVPSTTRDHKEMLEKMQAIETQIARPRSLIRAGTIAYLKTLAENRKMEGIDEKWLQAFFKMLRERGVDKALMEIVDIRYNPKLHYREKAQAYKTALLKLGLVFENTLVIVGRNHIDPEVQKTFRTKRHLNIKYMLTRLFQKDEVLKAVLGSYCDFDRSRDAKDFEKKVQELLGKEGDELPLYARYYALTTLVRNYYSHDGCQDTIANVDEQMFLRILNEGLCSALSLFRFFADRDRIVGFSV